MNKEEGTQKRNYLICSLQDGYMCRAAPRLLLNPTFNQIEQRIIDLHAIK